MKDQRGFTLIEVLVVILIIGVLATVVLAVMGSAKTRSNDKKVAAQLKTMISQALLSNGGALLTSGTYSGSLSVEAGLTPTGLNDATTIPTYGATGSGSGTRNLFTTGVASENGLNKLIKGLPKGTMVLYGKTKGTPGNAAGTWAVAASTSTGSICVDSRQIILKKSVVVSGATVAVSPSVDTLLSQWPNLRLPGTQPTLTQPNCGGGNPAGQPL